MVVSVADGDDGGYCEEVTSADWWRGGDGVGTMVTEWCSW
nr:hypothetical protein [Tanacetum cinerariifolium]